MNTPSEPKEPRRNPVRSSHVIAVGLAIAATVWIASGVVTGKAPTKEDVATEAKVPLTLVRVRTSSAETRASHVTLFGRTEAVNSISLAAETAGKVVSRPVEKGAKITKGTPILKLAMNDRIARLNEAEANVAYRKLAYESARKLSKKQFQSTIKVAEQKSALETAKAALAAIRLDISRTTVRAPIDGFIETLPVNVGDHVNAGTAVAGLVNLDTIRVVAQVSERQVASLKIDDKAWALFPGGASHEGAVRYISRVGQNSTRTFRVEVWIDNPEGAIAEGLTAELQLPTGSSRAHRVSPAVLTLDDSGVIGVKAVDDENKVVFHAVELLEDTTAGVWIGGLPENLTLITVGQEFVRTGQSVRTKDEASDTASTTQKS
ncbi:MAG: efflux RND transporter periplasmic adaptor subunit [Rhodospirillaceae bacterium]|nr:efflux RND transporter periplasmic adaptor subunit [Rhodospirillaceae bacterium]